MSALHSVLRDRLRHAEAAVEAANRAYALAAEEATEAGIVVAQSAAPTRERIAGHLVGIRLWTGDSSPALVLDRSLSAQIAYALRALLSQPTPSAEHEHARAHPISVVARSVVHSLLTEADSEDIALWEDYPEIGENDWDEVIAAARALAPVAPSEDEYRSAYAALDPSTIRDVTPPKVTP